MNIAANVAAVLSRIDIAARGADRNPEEIRLLLATKVQPVSEIAEAVAAVRRFRPNGSPVLIGENRVQEMVEKAPTLLELLPAGSVEFHEIGPVQKNKINSVLRSAVSCVESIDSFELAQAFSDRCVAADRTLRVMLQVNVTGETSKSGAHPSSAPALAAQIAELPNLTLSGFMCLGLPPQFDEQGGISNTEQIRAGYRELAEIRDIVGQSGAISGGTPLELSMGMSNDLELAIAEGATIVRVGSAIFGARGSHYA
ncbi:MAG: YggS family pyridoxal phosphate-dependent enzyme [Promicromonosporaceae bacterium]|nr:YggS family pyridoxal phosphate-dependent enzyme [Promicromonosporaceae bacterium]